MRDELTKLLTEGAARRGFELLDETGLLDVVLPDIARMKGVEQPPQYHPEGDVWIHTRMMLEKLQPALLPDAGLGRAAARCGQAAHVCSGDRARHPHPLRRPRGDRRAHGGGHLPRAAFLERRYRADRQRWSPITCVSRTSCKCAAATLKRFVRLPRFEEHLELHRLDCLASHGNLEAYTFVQRFLVETPPEQVTPQAGHRR